MKKCNLIICFILFGLNLQAQISTEEYDALGDSILNYHTFYWNYESPNCTPTTYPIPESTAGAVVVANNGATDFTLLRLMEDPKNKSDVNCTTVNFTNQTVTTNISVTGCKIYVQDVTVTNGAKLTLDAADETLLGAMLKYSLARNWKSNEKNG